MSDNDTPTLDLGWTDEKLYQIEQAWYTVLDNFPGGSVLYDAESLGLYIPDYAYIDHNTGGFAFRLGLIIEHIANIKIHMANGSV